MSKSKETALSLIAENSEFEDALSVVLAQAQQDATSNSSAKETQLGTVAWDDVNNKLTSGQWGRLIETGILHDGDGDGFAISNPNDIQALLDDRSTDPQKEDVDSSSGWSIYDKIAALVAISFIPAYQIQALQNLIASTVDVIMGPLDSILPFYVMIIVLSVFTGFYSTFLQASLMDTEKMGVIQEKMSDIQKRREKARERDDDAALERIQEEQMDAMSDQLGMFKLMFRPMVWIMLITIPAFLWMYWMLGVGGSTSHIAVAESSIVLPLLGQVEWTEGIAGPLQTWIVWYGICSFVFRLVIQKSLGLQVSPT